VGAGTRQLHLLPAIRGLLKYKRNIAPESGRSTPEGEGKEAPPGGGLCTRIEAGTAGNAWFSSQLRRDGRGAGGEGACLCTNRPPPARPRRGVTISLKIKWIAALNTVPLSPPSPL